MTPDTDDDPRFASCAGSDALEEEFTRETGHGLAAIDATGGKYGEEFSGDYLEEFVGLA